MTFADMFNRFEMGMTPRSRHFYGLWAQHMAERTEESLTVTRLGYPPLIRLTKVENGTIAALGSNPWLQQAAWYLPVHIKPHWDHGWIIRTKANGSRWPLTWYVQGKDSVAFHEDGEGRLTYITPPRRTEDEEIVHWLRRGARYYKGYAFNWEEAEPSSLDELLKFTHSEPTSVVVRAAMQHSGIVAHHGHLPERTVRDALRTYYTDKYYELKRAESEPTLPL